MTKAGPTNTKGCKCIRQRGPSRSTNQLETTKSAATPATPQIMATKVITNLGALPSLRKMKPLHKTRKVQMGTINDTANLPTHAIKLYNAELRFVFSVVSIDTLLLHEPDQLDTMTEIQSRSQQGDIF